MAVARTVDVESDGADERSQSGDGRDAAERLLVIVGRRLVVVRPALGRVNRRRT